MPVRMGLGGARKEKLEAELNRIIPLLKELKVIKAILFGSLAKDQVGTASDLDLILVLESEKPFIKRLDDIYTYIEPRVGLDLLAYTPEEYERMKDCSSFIRRAVKEGRVIYEA